ncbi:MAG: nucleoside-diphosphate-sugar epimerase [Candidatus Peregrinibacteria bacterium Gr01-1014_25]|nr:MAG: nucleoside-diphosphate-sugar epimerase [Candidatus Peregrinibacteria bacterium Gr01-1014_25]
MKETVLVTGGAGYVGSLLVPRLLREGYRVRVLDMYLYGDEALEGARGNPNLEEVRGDIRDRDLLRRALAGCDVVIHLACISNDPSFELNPALGKTINLDAFEPLVQEAVHAGVQRFIFASSASVYGVKDVENVTEDMPLEPLTDYSKYKAMCEGILARYQSPDFTTVTLRPATICGYAPRQRLDVVVNILTNHAYHHRKINVFGGEQKRPNLHIADMVDAYMLMLTAPANRIAGKVYNVGGENHTVHELAEIVRGVVGDDVTMETVPTDDPRSYHISSAKIAAELGFRPSRSIADAAHGLVEAFEKGLLPNAMTDARYFNIKRMQELNLQPTAQAA